MLQILLYSLMTVTLLLLSFSDAHTYQIPLKYNLFLGLLGMVQVWADRANWQEYVIGCLGMGLFLEVLSLVTNGSTLGGGDVKLMAACGLLLGWRRIFLAFALGCVIALVVHTGRMMLGKAGRVIALGPYLSIGIFVSALWGERIIII